MKVCDFHFFSEWETIRKCIVYFFYAKKIIETHKKRIAVKKIIDSHPQHVSTEAWEKVKMQCKNLNVYFRQMFCRFSCLKEIHLNL